MALADHARDAVDELDRLDPALEQAEERLAVALVRRIFARGEADVPGRPGETLAAFDAESGEVGNALDFFRRDHLRTKRYCVRQVSGLPRMDHSFSNETPTGRRDPMSKTLDDSLV